jgi:hypothetical protein
MSDDLSPQKQSVALDLAEQAADGAILNLSGAGFVGRHLYLANDEGRALLRLERDAASSHAYGKPVAIDIAPLFKLDDEELDPAEEFDLEALAVDRVDKQTVRVWMIGSHAMGHKKPKGATLKRLGLKRQRNRLLFACFETGNDGVIRPNRGRHLRIKPASQTHTTDFLSALRAARPRADGFLREVSALTEAKIPPHIADAVGWFTPYTLASTKENGLDIEALAIRRDDDDPSSVVAYIGLRGPVIDGLAVVIEIDIRDHNKRGLKIASAPRFHLVDLRGFGVRDLEWDDGDLLILAGPTMTRQKESALFRWRDAKNASAERSENDVREVGGIEQIGRLPMAPDCGGPEAFTRIAPGSLDFMVLRDGIKGPRLVDRDGKETVDGPIYRAEVYRVP